MSEQFDFSQALEYLKEGRRVTRASWLGSATVDLQSNKFLLNTKKGAGVEWRPTVKDILADDWTYA